MPCPTRPWAALVYPALDAGRGARAAVGADPAHLPPRRGRSRSRRGRARQDVLVGVAERLTARRFDALHFEGPGTDLRVGLLPTSRWLSARFETVDGIVHMPNLPTEEVFTAPDPLRVDGYVRSTKPLVVGGTIVRGLRVALRGRPGRVVRRRRGRRAAGALRRARRGRRRAWARSRSSTATAASARSTRSSTTRCIDENAASHIALGSAYEFTAGEQDHRAPEPLADPHRLHDRLARGRRHRRHGRRRARARAARRRLADLSAGRPPARPPTSPASPGTLGDPGEVPERLNGHDWKSCVGFTVHRGFESLSLRQFALMRTLAQRKRAGVRFVSGPAAWVRRASRPASLAA